MQDVQRLPEIAIPDRRSVARSDVLVGVLLVVVMLVGGYFRFTGLNWDDFTHLHPDERFLTDVAQGIGHDLNPSGSDDAATAQIIECSRRYPDTAGVGPYFDALCSTLNPLNANKTTGLYVYGTLPLFIARGGAELWAQGSTWIAHNILVNRDPAFANYDGSWWATYDGVQLVWRFLSMLAEMIIILVVFVIGTKLHDKWIGLLAAFFYSVTVFSIQMAHFGTVDSMANLFSALTILFAVLVQRGGKLVNYALFGLFFGCSVASRINLVPLAALIAVAALLQVLPVLDGHAAPGERRNTLLYHAFGCLLAAFVSLLAFRVFNPYAFVGPGFFGLSINQRWWDNMVYAQQLNAGVVDSPPNFQWVARIPYIYPLDNMILWGMGVPLGIIAWISWVWAGIRALRGKAGALNNLLLIVWVLIYFGWLGRNWVTTMRYFLPIYPVLMVLAAWGLVSLVRSARNHVWRRRAARLLLYATAVIALLWSGMFTNIYRHLLTRVAATYWVWEHVPGDFAMQVDGQPDAPLIQIPLANSYFGGTQDDIVSRVTRIDPSINGQPQTFTAPVSGTVTKILAPHLASLDPAAGPQVLHFTITKEGDPTLLATATLDSTLPSDGQNLVGKSYEIPLDNPLTVEQGARYSFNIEMESSSTILSGGSIFTWEGAWDDPVPTGVCALPIGTTVEDNPSSGLLMDKRDCKNWLDPWSAFANGYQQDIVYEDEPSKRDHLLLTLDHSDYITITSNRFYDTLSRNPMRWPLTNFYYQKLFAGELGYDLVATFQQTFELGPLRVSDQYLPTYSGPKWFNELESEEAFSVYDHPVVFIFKKNASYDAQAIHDLFYSIPLTRANDSPIYMNCPGVTSYYCDPTIVNVATLSSDQAAKAPTDLEFTQPMREEQYDNGTWSERFDQNSIVNTNQPVAVVVWWMTVLVFGFAAFPLLFVLLPGLADRGYGLAKFAGMFLAGWGTWYLASLRVPVWSQVGIAVALAVVFLIGLLLLWRRREEFVGYLRAHWKRLALIELITLLAFLAFVGVRLSNPDLWNPSFGGEKPMDFAYFNGVLRSTIFPPIDPWYSGGYINYYYFGFVIVGTPVLLLKMFPSIAYNLILPTLFALTGIAAFSVAFNLVHALRDRISLPSGTGGGVVTRARRLGSPWVAGIMALLLAVTMGNLDTPRQFLSGVARSGGYTQPTGMQDFLIQRYKDANSGVTPNQDALAQIIKEAADPSVGDKVSYEANNSVELLVSLGSGIAKMISGQEMYVSPDRWFWGPTRILAETPGVEGNAINEMPIFTYVYGDMHAHMISMPMQLAVVGLLLNEVLLAGSPKRKRWFMVASAALIGLYVGMLRATNTWDWITFMILSGVGLVFAWWLSLDGKRSFWRHFSRRSLLDLGLYAGTFLAVMVISSIPYNEWFATTYNRVLPWTDGKTPLWAYFDIHGLFLFLIISLLVWETGRWLRGVYVRALRGLWLGLMFALLIVVALLVTAIVLSLASYQVTLVVLPLLVWIAILFFRRGQSRVMQFVLIVTGLALGLTLGVEYVVLDGDIGRQNTVFKFYLQAWLMMSVIGGAAFAWLMSSLPRWNGALRGVWTFVLVVLLAVAALFPIMAIRGKAIYRFDLSDCAPVTLDGMDYMKCAEQYEGNPQIIATPGFAPFPLDEDYAMIRWLQENVKGTPTIMEGLSEDPQYHWDSRISIYTGLPAVVGWNWHQRQQRGLDPFSRIVETRNANVNAFYQSTSIGTAWDMIQYYHVSYVIVGRLESAYYQAAGLEKFGEMVQLGLLKPVFSQGNSTIYQVNLDAKLAEQG